MCYQIVERYVACNCLYYTHDVDMCAAYGSYEHNIEEKTVLVGYTCSDHGNGSTRSDPAKINHVTNDEVGKTSPVQEPTDLDQAPEHCSDSNVDFDPPASDNSVLEDFIARIRSPAKYLDKLQSLQLEVFGNSTASLRFFGSTKEREIFPLTAPLTLRLSPTSSEEILDPIQRIPDEHQATIGNTFRSILDAQNVLAKALANLTRYSSTRSSAAEIGAQSNECVQ